MFVVMVEKKTSGDWYIASKFFLIAGFTFPVLATAAFALALIIFGVTEEDILDTSYQLAAEFLQIVSIWFGVKYAARYIRKTYTLPRPQHVIKLATAYLAFVLSVLTTDAFLGFSGPAVSNEILALYTVGTILSCIVFYYESRKSLV
ncbi:hypothetical protein A3C18_03140 [Candidatus Kaiserbacteria bacterium RIFCSPHIGHO2_02_FULL_54_11b]|uniref:Uncharacterized protein n=2 Tax=Candidatus Kaiseribacteriota TaxID=1752734 RepID=A0A1F6CSH5_9BACT|nr:MAG: hypothetical protein A2704_06380 [Candidatus Kaiserbacteria bacterium RIFCSPHIGHO2_01_FULL_54_36b]OGG64468.1 MAG: hypothetical protein A3C18_03140 [Candidatus Kaiserbacteria bacterium RIFCSPHIGHO2_02_FULL_54_11b]